jgi:hypothetical protein
LGKASFCTISNASPTLVLSCKRQLGMFEGTTIE